MLTREAALAVSYQTVLRNVKFYIEMLNHKNGYCVYGQTNRQTDRHIDRHTERHTERQTGRQTDRHTDAQTDRRKDRQTDGRKVDCISSYIFMILSELMLQLNKLHVNC